MFASKAVPLFHIIQCIVLSSSSVGGVILGGISINCKCSSCSPGRPSCYIAHLLSHGRRHVGGHLDEKSREERKVPKSKFTLKISKSYIIYTLYT